MLSLSLRGPATSRLNPRRRLPQWWSLDLSLPSLSVLDLPLHCWRRQLSRDQISSSTARRRPIAAAASLWSSSPSSDELSVALWISPAWLGPAWLRRRTVWRRHDKGSSDCWVVWSLAWLGLDLFLDLPLDLPSCWVIWSPTSRWCQPHEQRLPPLHPHCRLQFDWKRCMFLFGILTGVFQRVTSCVAVVLMFNQHGNSVEGETI